MKLKRVLCGLALSTVFAVSLTSCWDNGPVPIGPSSSSSSSKSTSSSRSSSTTPTSSSETSATPSSSEVAPSSSSSASSSESSATPSSSEVAPSSSSSASSSESSATPSSSSSASSSESSATPSSSSVTPSSSSSASSTSDAKYTPIEQPKAQSKIVKCKSNKTYSSSYEAGSDLDIYYSYNGSFGYVDVSSAFHNPITEKNYAAGDILPLWELYGTKLNVNIRNAFMHDGQKSTAKYDCVRANCFKSEIDLNAYIDLYGTTVDTINKMGAEGTAVDLTPYINAGMMPNFNKFLVENPDIKNQITYDGNIYYTPFFDGYNNIEKMIQMDTASVKKVLNVGATGASSASYDTDVTNNGKEGAATGLVACEFQPFVGTNDYNYATDTTVSVSVGGVAKTMTVKKTSNIIALQNTLLNAGCTGKALADQFVTYLQTAYADGFTKGYYATCADIFISESAAYNTDDLIALMRVFKANPRLVSNNMDTEDFPLIVREGGDNRISTLLQWMGTVFGIQGMASETDFLFYGADGKLNDAALTKASYEGLDLMAQLYDEGLLLKNFYVKADGLKVRYAQSYFAKSVGVAKDDGSKSGKSGYALMEYDYAGTQSAFNAKDANGIGTAASKVESGYTAAELMSVLAPLTYWAVDSFDVNANLTARDGKKLIRYYEENRSLMSDSWCIPSMSDNIGAAVAMMDYLYSEEGQIYNDFGPEEYWEKDELGNVVYQTIGGITTPCLSSAVFDWYGKSGLGDYWRLLRSYIGTADAIGYVRTAAIDYESTNAIGKIGYKNVDNAVQAGVQLHSTNDNKFTFGSTVPVKVLPRISNYTAGMYDAITTFWQISGKWNQNAYGWVKYIVSGYGTDLTNTVMGIGTNTKSDFKYSAVVSGDEPNNRKTEYLDKYREHIDANFDKSTKSGDLINTIKITSNFQYDEEQFDKYYYVCGNQTQELNLLRDDAVFVGLYSDGTLVSTDPHYKVTGDGTNKEYTAKYTKLEIIIDNENLCDEVSVSGDLAVDSKITITPVYDSENIDFVGWYKNDTLVSEDASLLWTLSSANDTIDLLLKGKTITVTLDANGGVLDYYDSIDLEYGNAFNLPVPTLEGKTFAGWVYIGETRTNTNGMLILLTGSDGKSFLPFNFVVDVKLAAIYSNGYKFVDTDQIEFGSYPQTKETNETTINTLTSLVGELPTEAALNGWTDYGYYIQGSVSSYMYYIDVDLDSNGTNDYRGVYFTSYRPAYTSMMESSSEFSIQEDNGYTINNVYWFKYEPVKWTILRQDDGKAYIVSNLLLDSQDYNHVLNKEVDGVTVDAYDYAESSVREWLVSFYNTVFTDVEKETISQSTIDNSYSTTNPLLNDNLFLLSKSVVQLCCTSDDILIAQGTDYAKCQGLYVDSDNNGAWWLRISENSVNYVFSNGEFQCTYVISTYFGVRAACRINL